MPSFGQAYVVCLFQVFFGGAVYRPTCNELYIDRSAWYFCLDPDNRPQLSIDTLVTRSATNAYPSSSIPPRSASYTPPLLHSDVGSASDYSPSTPPEQAASLDDGNMSGSDSHPSHSKPTTANSSLRRRRGNLPKNVTTFLRNWLVQHKRHPYPTEDEKIDLARRTSLTVNQISNWFINARRRILQPILRNEQMHAASVAKKEHVNMHDFGKFQFYFLKSNLWPANI
jgi:hypothetical protein